MHVHTEEGLRSTLRLLRRDLRLLGPGSILLYVMATELPRFELG